MYAFRACSARLARSAEDKVPSGSTSRSKQSRKAQWPGAVFAFLRVHGVRGHPRTHRELTGSQSH